MSVGIENIFAHSAMLTRDDCNIAILDTLIHTQQLVTPSYHQNKINRAKKKENMVNRAY